MNPLPILSQSQAATTWTGQRTFDPLTGMDRKLIKDIN